MCSTDAYYSTSKRFFQVLQSILIYSGTVACACSITGISCKARRHPHLPLVSKLPDGFVGCANPATSSPGEIPRTGRQRKEKQDTGWCPARGIRLALRATGGTHLATASQAGIALWRVHEPMRLQSKRRADFRHGVNNKKDTPECVLFVIGDPYGNRTHVTAVKGPCLNLLTNGPGSGSRI